MGESNKPNAQVFGFKKNIKAALKKRFKINV